MTKKQRYVSTTRRALLAPLSGTLVIMALSAPAVAAPLGPPLAPPGRTPPLIPGDLLVTTSVYRNDPNIVAGQTALPPGCSDPSATNANCMYAVANGNYPYVFNNDTVDGSFGVTSPIILREITPFGRPVAFIEVPNSGEPWVTSGDDQMVTSFSSKSELAINLSTEGNYVTFVGYNAPVDSADVSNASTPGAPDPTNPVVYPYYRVVAELGRDGQFHFTETNAFSGDNGRAAILNEASDLFYAAGNAGNGSNPEPNGVVLGAGAQLIQPSDLPEAAQDPSTTPTPVGSFNINQLGDAVDKSAKDDNFRGLTLYNDVLYYTKGSGGNGVDSVYFVDTSGKACPTGGVGLPQTGATLPTTSAFTVTNYQTNPKKTADPGLTPENMCILKGFPTALATNATDASDYPFGLWFANPDTVYVADEGAGDNTNTTFSATSNGTYSAAAASTTAGLQKWTFDSSTGQWNLAYTIQSGLNLGQPYTVPGYPTSINATADSGTGLPWAPATDGLRNLTGRVNPNGTVTVWATTSTVSGGGDQGADPNELVTVTDNLNATSLSPGESFHVLAGPTYGTVFRGVSFTPGTVTPHFPPGPGSQP